MSDNKEIKSPEIRVVKDIEEMTNELVRIHAAETLENDMDKIASAVYAAANEAEDGLPELTVFIKYQDMVLYETDDGKGVARAESGDITIISATIHNDDIQGDLSPNSEELVALFMEAGRHAAQVVYTKPRLLLSCFTVGVAINGEDENDVRVLITGAPCDMSRAAIIMSTVGVDQENGHHKMTEEIEKVISEDPEKELGDGLLPIKAFISGLLSKAPTDDIHIEESTIH